LVLLVAAFAMVMGAGPAWAAPPVIERFEDNNFGDPDYFDCPDGGQLMGVFTVEGTETIHFDEDGNPVRLVVHEHFDGVLTRTDTGNSIKDPGRITIVVDLVTGEATVTGLWWNFTYPGLGSVFQVIGRSVFLPDVDGPVFKAGPGDFLDGLDLIEEVCKALA
jgi:hypothetical protein